MASPRAGRDTGVIAPEGIPFLVAAALVTAVLAFAWPKSAPVAIAALVLTAWVGWFFRNPARTPPDRPGAVISPADGKIIFSGDVAKGHYNDAPCRRVSVFMNVFDVHVNRAPVSGKVAWIRYNPGKFLVASGDKASLENEQNAVAVETPGGERVVYVQIAGLVARRIVCDLSQGESVTVGQRVGMIRFGSRVDVYLPASAALEVAPGDRVRAGETVLGVMQ